MDHFETIAIIVSVLVPCGGGFFYLNKRMDTVSKEVKENHIIQQEIKRIFDVLKNIESTLNGSLDSPGIIGRLRDHESAICRIEERCKVEHGQ